MRKNSARSQSFIIEFLKFLVFWSVKFVIKKAIHKDMYRQIWALPTNYWKESYVFDAKIVATFGAPPIPKSWLRHWWAPTEKKIVSPLRSSPPQSKTASGAPGLQKYWKPERKENLSIVQMSQRRENWAKYWWDFSWTWAILFFHSKCKFLEINRWNTKVNKSKKSIPRFSLLLYFYKP